MILYGSSVQSAVLILTPLIPARYVFLRVFRERLAGPIVQIVFVLFTFSCSGVQPKIVPRFKLRKSSKSY